MRRARRGNGRGAHALHRRLHAFLFGSDRASLDAYRPLLEELQEGRCLYCDRRLSGTPPVDHFIPWRRYPVDLGHNFVLAHDGCNSRKGDRLAAEVHLGRWWDRNTEHADRLGVQFDEKGLPHDREASRRVAAWAYGQLDDAGGLAWLIASQMEPLRGEWRGILKR